MEQHEARHRRILMGSLHRKQKISTVNKNKTKIQSRKSQDLIYEDRSNEMYVRLTLEDFKALTRSDLVVDVVDHLPLAKARRRS